jgi:hypothetical protein
MQKIQSVFLSLFLLTCLFLAGCAPQADFDIRGEWEYTMISDDGNTYDAGTITFSGQPTQGTYLQFNFYQIEYDGGYTVNGVGLELTGHETWQGTITDANSMSGSWAHEDGATGVFSATRK